MKYSNKARHFASTARTIVSNKNRPGHQSLGGSKVTPNKSDAVKQFAHMLLMGLSRRTRRVFIQQENALQTRKSEKI
jgi:hypothetical protein